MGSVPKFPKDYGLWLRILRTANVAVLILMGAFFLLVDGNGRFLGMSETLTTTMGFIFASMSAAVSLGIMFFEKRVRALPIFTLFVSVVLFIAVLNQVR